MTCATTNLLLAFNRPGDLGTEERAALDAHLATCPACAGQSALREDDAAIAAAMKAVTIPVGFRDALQNSAISTQNGLWRAAWARRLSATAAAFMMLLLGYGVIANLARPGLDSNQLLADFDLRGSGGLDYDDWRHVEGVPLLPEDFDLRLMTFAGRQPLHGRLTPTIRLQAANGQDAIVYFVRDAQFRLGDLAESVGSENSVRVYRDQPGGWTVVVVHTGSSLAPFLHRPGSAA